MKDTLSIRTVSKQEVVELLNNHHYLSGISRGFKSGFNYGLFEGEDIVGACIFTGLPVPELVKGMFNMDRSEQQGKFELSRLVLHPRVQSKYKNTASWFVSRAIKSLKADTDVHCILSYADSGYHKGFVYQALNFNYYGLTDKKKDFYILNEDGTYTKHSRGKTKGVRGEWRDRTQKHRYVLFQSKKLESKMLWKQEAYPK